ncbi:MAG: hypothetical protein EXQ94_07420 [Alphaproteobacteria bacterium]|nr:hypothetical protein [Alphaproteobacteria bacterium]
MPQCVWGEGFLTPGGRDFVLGMLKGIDVKEGMRLADLDAGLGGAGFALVQEKKVVVSAVGCSPELAAAGAELWGHLGLGDKIAPVSYDRAKPSLPKAAYNHAIAKDGVDPQAAYLSSARDSLQPNGHIVVAQVVGPIDALDPLDVAVLFPQRMGGRAFYRTRNFSRPSGTSASRSSRTT